MGIEVPCEHQDCQLPSNRQPQESLPPSAGPDLHAWGPKTGTPTGIKMRPKQSTKTTHNLTTHLRLSSTTLTFRNETRLC